MENTSLSLEEQLRALIRTELTEAKVKLEEQSRLRVGEQVRAAVSQAEESMKSEFEEKLNAAAAAATLQRDQEIRAASSLSEEKLKDRIERLEAAVAEAQKDEDVGPRNLVVCIDGTANQFGVKVRTRLNHSCSSFPIQHPVAHRTPMSSSSITSL